MFLETHTLPKIVKRLLIINIGIFIFLLITGIYRNAAGWFALIPQEVLHHFQIWRLFTYLFLHAGLLHIIINMYVLWMFGPEIERGMGSSQFLFYYLFTGIGGGLFPLILSNPVTPIVGASASIFGLLVAFGIMFPDAIITLIIPPVSMKAKHFVIVIGVIAFLILLSGPTRIAWDAHLGGMLFGYLYFRYGIKRGGGYGRKWNISAKLRDFRDKWARLQKQQRKQFIEEEIDPILDKMSKVGIKGLTRRERQILKKAKYKV